MCFPKLPPYTLRMTFQALRMRFLPLAKLPGVGNAGLFSDVPTGQKTWPVMRLATRESCGLQFRYPDLEPRHGGATMFAVRVIRLVLWEVDRLLRVCRR